MRKNVLLIIENLCSVLFFIGILGVFANIAPLLSKGDYSKGLMYFAPFLLTVIFSGIATVYTKRLIFYLLITLGSAFSVLLFGFPTVISVLCIIISVIIIIIRIKTRVENSSDFFLTIHYGFILTLAFFYVISALLKNEMMMRLEYYTLFLYLILYLAHKNLSNLKEYLDYNSSVENIPTAKIRKTNSGILTVFLVVSIILMFALPKLGLDKMLILLFEFLFVALKYLISLLSKNSSESSSTSFGEQLKEELEGGFGYEEGYTPPWLEFLINVITYIFIIAVAAILLYGLIRAIYSLFREFKRNFRTGNDEEEFINPTENKAERLKKIPGTPLWRDFSPNGSVRKAYRKMIAKKKAPDRSSYTPTELENYALLENSDRRTLLHLLYEKARYSNESCTKEDVKSITRK